MKGKEYAYRCSVANLKERENLEDVSVDRKLILNFFLNK